MNIIVSFVRHNLVKRNCEREATINVNKTYMYIAGKNND